MAAAGPPGDPPEDESLVFTTPDVEILTAVEVRTVKASIKEYTDTLPPLGQRWGIHDRKLIVRIHPNTREIADEAFRRSDFEVPTYLELNQVERVGNRAFQNAEFMRINFGTKLQSIGNEAFDDVPIVVVDLPDSVHTVGPDAFGYIGDPEGGHTFKVPRSMKVITHRAFAHMSAHKIVIHDEVTVVGNEAFAHADAKEVVFEGQDYWIDRSAFNGSFVRSIDLTHAAYIGPTAFFDCRYLERLILPPFKIMCGSLFTRICPHVLIIPEEVAVLEPGTISFDPGCKVIVATDRQIADLRIRTMPTFPEKWFKSIAGWATEMNKTGNMDLLIDTMAPYEERVPMVLRRVFNALTIERRKKLLQSRRISKRLRDEIAFRLHAAKKQIQVSYIPGREDPDGEYHARADRPENALLAGLTLERFTRRD